MLAGHGGELVFGIGTFVIGVGFVWLMARAAVDGARRREADRRQQHG